ncbi:thioredoxin-like protein [Xylariomycetidae sp. FL0641]|nr:thioredoxin-like protein [Xylariomycetidae sp. FL0641]
MALPPKFAGHKLAFSLPGPAQAGAAVPPAMHTLELYLDFVCPFSAKQFLTLYDDVLPLIRGNPRWAANLQLLFRPQVQPWHPASTLAHEAGVAVLQAAPARFWDFAALLMRRQEEFFDARVVNEARNQTYRRLARIAAEVGVGEDEVYQRLVVSDRPAEDGSLNAGNRTTDDLKVLVKMARLVGIHVSPTVLFDGVVAGDISSSWTKEQWREWLEKNIG